MAALTAAQREIFDRDGLVTLPGAVPVRDATAMAEALWRELERRGYRRNDPTTWETLMPAGFAPLARTGAFAAMASPTVKGAIEDLIGPGWQEPSRWGLPLVTLPNRNAEWTIPHTAWHLDIPATAEPPAIARVFLLLVPLRPRGGGTLVVLGSHRLVQNLAITAGQGLRSADAARRLRTDYPWFAALSAPDAAHDRIHRFMQEGAHIDGIHIRIAEMTGNPGDVLLMHPSALHAASPNTGDTPRMMLTQYVLGQAAAAPTGMGPT